MLCLRVLALSWALVLGAPSLSGAETRQQQGTDGSPGSSASVHILECKQDQLPKLVNAVEQGGGEIRHKYDSSIFQGVSFRMLNATHAQEIIDKLRTTHLLKNYWPAQAISLEPAYNISDVSHQAEAQKTRSKEMRSRRAPQIGQFSNASKRAGPESPWTHLMTNVDKLHKEGYLGKGITVAVIDTGVDYTHPALGGCFGTGCRVAKGANLVTAGGNTSDPMDHRGHGTKVAGVVAGYDAENGFMGAVPNATIHAYRVFDSTLSSTDDDYVAGWLQAYEDGAQVMVSSTSTDGHGWAQSPAALVVSRIVASGIPCIIAMGNTFHGPFEAVVPSTGRDVVAVNSVSRDHDDMTDDCAYRIDDGTEMAFGLRASTPHAWGAGSAEDSEDFEELEVHDVDADYGDNIDDLGHAQEVQEGGAWDKVPDCKLSPGDDGGKGLAGRVALVRRSLRTQNCSFEQRVVNAAARGATHILAWQEDGPVHLDAPRDAKGIIAIGMIDAAVGKAMAKALSAAKKVKMHWVGRHRVTTGSIASYSSFGPTYDLDIKPEVLAPGDGATVPIPFSGGSYETASGTSFAAPLVAGIYALVGEARGTFDPAVLNSLIVGTAEPQFGNYTKYNKVDGFLSAAQQGGGLVRAWEAAHATTLVAPGRLVFNDTAHRVPSISLRVENRANSTVQYRLSYISAATVYTLGEGSPAFRQANQNIQAPAKIHLSQSVMALGPGQSDTIDVSALDPEGLDTRRLPLWSGWVVIAGSDGTRLTVPYLGLAGSLRDATVFGPAPAILRPGVKINWDSIPPDTTVILKAPPGIPVADMPSSTSYRKADPLVAEFLLVLGSPEVQVYAVPLSICSDSGMNATAPVSLDLTRTCVPQAVATPMDVGGLQTIGQVINSPYRYVGSGRLGAIWDGSLLSGHFAPPGRYKLVARALSILGDRNITSNWQVAESGEFSIAYEDEDFLSIFTKPPTV